MEVGASAPTASSLATARAWNVVAAAPSPAAMSEIEAYLEEGYNPPLLYKVGNLYSPESVCAFSKAMSALGVPQEQLLAMTIRSGGQYVEVVCKKADLAQRLLRTPVEMGSRRLLQRIEDRSPGWSIC